MLVSSALARPKAAGGTRLGSSVRMPAADSGLVSAYSAARLSNDTALSARAMQSRARPRCRRRCTPCRRDGPCRADAVQQRAGERTDEQSRRHGGKADPAGQLRRMEALQCVEHQRQPEHPLGQACQGRRKQQVGDSASAEERAVGRRGHRASRDCAAFHIGAAVMRGKRTCPAEDRSGLMTRYREEPPMPDDIPMEPAASQTERQPGSSPDTGNASVAGHRQVGPESEVRGGPEAPKTTAKNPSRGAGEAGAKAPG